MSNYKKRLPPIKYTSRDFQSIRADLISHAKRYYPDTFKDFSEASFGALMVDSVAYVGDILSFYLDYQVNESFLDTSIEYNNILRHGRSLGYKFAGRGTASGEVTLFIIVPANDVGMGYDSDYVPVLKAGSSFSSNEGARFTLTDDVRFDQSNNQVVVARVNESTGVPTHYAIRSQGSVVSGRLQSKSFTIGEFERFRKIKIGGPNVSEIINVIDQDGNVYYEVDYLSQDTVFREIVNKTVTNDSVPSILKPITVPRRFTVIKTRASTTLQFGYGSNSELERESIVDPKNITMDLFGRDYFADKAFDPSKLISSDKFGIGPQNTILTVTYRENAEISPNTFVNGVNKVVSKRFLFESENVLASSKKRSVINSLEVINEKPIVGDVSLPTVDEVRQRIRDVYASQNRAVTKNDYEALAMLMPQKFGLVKRVNVIRDPDSTKRNLNMFVLSENTNGYFTKANTTLKRNLKMWLSSYKMMSDTVDILDAKIVNIGIEYSIVVKPGADKIRAITLANSQLVARYQEKFYIGEPFYISEIYSIINRISDIIDVKNVRVVQKRRAPYSDIRFDIRQNTSEDGNYIVVPKNVALEIKFPNSDIKGTVV